MGPAPKKSSASVSVKGATGDRNAGRADHQHPAPATPEVSTLTLPAIDPMTMPLEDLAKRIDETHLKAEADIDAGVIQVKRGWRGRIEDGGLLHIAKKRVKAEGGDWLPWLNQQCGISQRDAQRNMRWFTYRKIIEAEIEKCATVADLRVRDIDALIASPKKSKNLDAPTIETTHEDETTHIEEASEPEDQGDAEPYESGGPDATINPRASLHVEQPNNDAPEGPPQSDSASGSGKGATGDPRSTEAGHDPMGSGDEESAGREEVESGAKFERGSRLYRVTQAGDGFDEIVIKWITRGEYIVDREVFVRGGYSSPMNHHEREAVEAEWHATRPEAVEAEVARINAEQSKLEARLAVVVSLNN